MNDAATKIPVTEDLAPQAEAGRGDRPSSAASPADRWHLDTLRREVERVFEEFQRGPWRLPFTRTAFDVSPVWPGEFMWKATPAVEIVERDPDYVITAELPGAAVGDIGVKLSDDRLTITGEKKEEKEEHRKGAHLSERRYGFFERSFRVPEQVERSGIVAQFKNGVLTITLPKTAQARGNERKIEVEAA